MISGAIGPFTLQEDGLSRELGYGYRISCSRGSVHRITGLLYSAPTHLCTTFSQYSAPGHAAINTAMPGLPLGC